MAHDWVAVRGARVHNLKNIDVYLPRDRDHWNDIGKRACCLFAPNGLFPSGQAESRVLSRDRKSPEHFHLVPVYDNHFGSL